MLQRFDQPNIVQYKESFQELRALKSDIENIQRVLEKSRLKMQADFEAWLGVMARQHEQELDLSPGRDPPAQAWRGASREQEERPPAGGNSGARLEARGMASTGNEEADADILAFYQAKEALLARRK